MRPPRNPAIFDSELIVNFDRSANKDFVLFKKEIRVLFEDEFQNRIAVRSWVVFFGDFIIQHGINLKSLFKEFVQNRIVMIQF